MRPVAKATTDPEPQPHKAVPVAHSTRDAEKIDSTIVGIACFKIAKGVLFLVLATAALRLWRHDINESAHYWMRLLGIKQESRWMHELLEHAGLSARCCFSTPRFFSPKALGCSRANPGRNTSPSSSPPR